MIAHLEGRLAEKAPNQVTVVVGGVGYRLFIPVSTYYELPDEGASVSLRVHTHVREDVLALYGFVGAVEELLFQRLISVAGVGPSLALKVMSGLEPTALFDAIRKGDVRRLNAIPGVGKKTAERLILELRDKLPEVASEDGADIPTASSSARSFTHDLLSALLNLGFPRALAERKVEAVVTSAPDIAFEDALKKALRELSG